MQIVVILLLFICSYTDIKSKEISLKVLGIFLVMTIIGILLTAFGIIKAFSYEINIWNICLGLILGLVLLIYSRISSEAIGEGDAYLLMLTGIMLGIKDNLVMFAGGILLSGIYAVFLLLLKKKEKTETFPFVPALLLSYILFTVITGIHEWKSV